MNAVTKSGTNRLSGSVPQQLPRQPSQREGPGAGPRGADRQSAIQHGGRRPHRADRLHYFGNFEYEREPKSSIWNTPYPAFNIELNGKATRKLGGVRLDYQLSRDARHGEGVGQRSWQPFGTRQPRQPSGADGRPSSERGIPGQLRQVLSNRAVNEVKAGYTHYGFEERAPHQLVEALAGASRDQRPPPHHADGLFDRRQRQLPPHRDQKVRPDPRRFHVSYDARGRHDLRLGVRMRAPFRGQARTATSAAATSRPMAGAILP